MSEVEDAQLAACFRYCETCGVQQPLVDEFDDQIGHEEQARPVHVVALDCGHDIVTELRR